MADRDRREAQIVADGQAGKDAASLRHISDARASAPVRRILGDRGTLEPDLARGRGQDADQRAQQRRLAHAVMTQNSYELALADIQRQPGDDRDAVVARTQFGDQGTIPRQAHATFAKDLGPSGRPAS